MAHLMMTNSLAQNETETLGGQAQELAVQLYGPYGGFAYAHDNYGAGVFTARAGYVVCYFGGPRHVPPTPCVIEVECHDRSEVVALRQLRDELLARVAAERVAA